MLLNIWEWFIDNYDNMHFIAQTILAVIIICISAAWCFVPFAIMGCKDRLDEIIRLLKKQASPKDE